MRLRIKMRNPMWERRHKYAVNVWIPEFLEYIGEPTKRKWVEDTSFCLTDPTVEGGFRVLERKNIVCGWRL